jgi:hypothetical protein
MVAEMMVLAEVLRIHDVHPWLGGHVRNIDAHGPACIQFPAHRGRN